MEILCDSFKDLNDQAKHLIADGYTEVMMDDEPRLLIKGFLFINPLTKDSIKIKIQITNLKKDATEEEKQMISKIFQSEQGHINLIKAWGGTYKELAIDDSLPVISIEELQLLHNKEV